MKYIHRFIALIACLVLAACGGGGGSGGSSGSGGGGTTTPGPTVSLVIVDASNQTVTSITSGGAYQAKATVKDANGAAVANRVVTFSVSGSSVATLAQPTALTDASGVAQVPIGPASFTSSGAATLTATVDVPVPGGTTTVTGTGTLDFAVTAAGLTLSPISIGSANLPSGGNTTLSVTAQVNGNALSGTPVNVAFFASCGRINGQDGSAGGVSVTTNGSGIASANYTAVNADGTLCSGLVNVSASSAGASTRTATLTVAAPVANAVTFVSASPAQIFVAGSGAAEQSVVAFKVFAASGTPLPGVSVVFSIQTNPGGVGLNASGSTANVTATTDQAGQATVSVFSGTIPGPVKVRAALAASPTVFAESQNLTIASGPPSQRFMSLSLTKINIEAQDRDGTSTQLTVRIADRQGNAVADGTVVNFTAEGGQVANSCATTTVNKISSCSVDFISQNPRPDNGRVSVLAYLAGTKDYVDNNGNNIFDAGDTLSQIGDAYRDDNENNAFDAGEFLIPRGGSLACAGVGGSYPSRENTCSEGLATTVRQAAVILFSSTSAAISSVSASAGGIVFKLGSVDKSGQPSLLPMPVGTTVTATPLADGCTVSDTGGSPVANVDPQIGNPAKDLTTIVNIGLKGCASGQRVNLKITAPSGFVTSIPVTLQ